MPPSRTSHSCPTAFTSDNLFHFSSTTTDIQHAYLLLAGRRHARDNYTTFVFLRQMAVRQEEEMERRQQLELNEINLIHKFAEAAFEEACFNGLDTVLKEFIVIKIEQVLLHQLYHLIHLLFLPLFNDLNDCLFLLQSFLNHLLILNI